MAFHLFRRRSYLPLTLAAGAAAAGIAAQVKPAPPTPKPGIIETNSPSSGAKLNFMSQSDGWSVVGQADRLMVNNTDPSSPKGGMLTFTKEKGWHIQMWTPGGISAQAFYLTDKNLPSSALEIANRAFKAVQDECASRHMPIPEDYKPLNTSSTTPSSPSQGTNASEAAASPKPPENSPAQTSEVRPRVDVDAQNNRMTYRDIEAVRSGGQKGWEMVTPGDRKKYVITNLATHITTTIEYTGEGPNRHVKKIDSSDGLHWKAGQPPVPGLQPAIEAAKIGIRVVNGVEDEMNKAIRDGTRNQQQQPDRRRFAFPKPGAS